MPIINSFLLFADPKILIAGGWGDGTTEILEIKTGKTIKLPDLPKGNWGLTGGMLSDIPLVCGGLDDQQCHQIEKDTITTFTSHLKSIREYAATTPKLQSLWVTGGFNSSYEDLKSTEVIQRDGSIVAGPDLPVAVNGHSMTEVKKDELYLLIGGDSDDEISNSTYFYNVSNGKWKNGPDLKEARRFHTAGLIFDKVNHTQYTVVVGGRNENDKKLSSVEILKEGSNEWTQGKSSNSFCHCVCLFLISKFFF